MKTIKVLMSTIIIAMSIMMVSGTAYAGEYLKYKGYCHHGYQKVCVRHCDFRGCWRHCEYRRCGWHRHHYYYR